MEPKEIRVIFTHNSALGKTQNFKEIPDDVDINDHTVYPMDSNQFRKLAFDGFKFKRGMNPGAIFKITRKSENTYSWSANSFPLGKWQIREEVVQWEALNKSDERMKSSLKDISASEISMFLEPIRTAYKSSSYQQREMILAQVIRSITG